MGDGSVDAEVPDGGGDEVFTWPEQGSEVKELVAPMSEVAARGAVADTMAVDVKDEAVVGADADDIGGGNGGQFEGVTKMENDGVAQRGGGVGDPGGVPLARGRIVERNGLGVT